MSNVEIYTRDWCGYCRRAKALLSQKGVDFTEYDIESEPARRSEMLDRANGRTSVPQIFIDAQHIGGCDDLYALDARGQLDALLTGQAGQ
jgi:glutaredoxin 3